MRNKMTVLLGLVAVFIAINVNATVNVILEWDASVDPEATIYRVYWGPASGNYTNSQSVGNVTTFVFAQALPGRTYYCVITASYPEGGESLPSNEINFTVPAGPLLDGSYIVSSGFSLDQNSGVISGNVFSLPTDPKSAYWAKGGLSVTQGQVLTLKANMYYGNGEAPVSTFLVNDATGFWLSPERIVYVDGSYGVRQTELAVFDSCTNAKLYVVSGHLVGSYQFQQTSITLTNPAVAPVPNLYLKQLLAKQSAGINSAEWEWQPADGAQGYVVRTALFRDDIELGDNGVLLGSYLLPAGQTTYRCDIPSTLYGGVYVSVTSVINGYESTPWITWYLPGDVFSTADEAAPPLCFQGKVDAVDVNFANAGYLTARRVPNLTPGMPARPEERVDIDNNTYAGRTSDLSFIRSQYSNGRRMQ